LGTCVPADRIIQSVLVHAPGTTEQVVQLQLFNTMDEFFRRTSVWRVESDIQMDENTREYSLPVPLDAAFVRIISLNLGGTPVPPTGGSTVQLAIGRLTADQTFGDGDTEYDADILGPPVGASAFSYAFYRPGYITLSQLPTTEQLMSSLNALIVLTIAKSSLECAPGDWQIEEWMHDMFFEDWLNGTLGRLFAMPSKPWSNKDLAAYHGKKYRQGMGQRKQESNRGFVYGRPGWRYPRQGGWV
jgi:hypothetical protein